MNTYKEQFQEVQEFAFNIIKEFSLDTTAPRVLMALADVRPVDRKQFFELNEGKTAREIYYALAHSGSIAQWLEDYALVAYIND